MTITDFEKNLYRTILFISDTVDIQLITIVVCSVGVLITIILIVYLFWTLCKKDNNCCYRCTHGTKNAIRHKSMTILPPIDKSYSALDDTQSKGDGKYETVDERQIKDSLNVEPSYIDLEMRCLRADFIEPFINYYDMNPPSKMKMKKMNVTM
ncbi:hypothetical protein SNEBB_002114 [Seison nebaliae]|nr:hypothetical protein SNEBB_002114 [Seison nebaliae]